MTGKGGITSYRLPVSHLISLSLFFTSLHRPPRACSPYLFILKPLIFIFFLPLVALMPFLAPILISFYFVLSLTFSSTFSCAGLYLSWLPSLRLWLSLSISLSLSICVPAAEHIVYSFSIDICKRNVCAHQSRCLSPLYLQSRPQCKISQQNCTERRKYSDMIAFLGYRPGLLFI